MPIYAFNCPEHGETERRLPMADAGTSQACRCGRLMTRKFTAATILVPTGGRQTVLDTLNREHSKTRPTRETLLMEAGLEEPKRTIGRGYRPEGVCQQ